MRVHLRVAAVLSSLVAVACGSPASTNTDTNTDTNTNTGTLSAVLSELPACTWASSLNDAGPGGCVAARANVECHNSAGDTCNALASDPPSGQTSCGAGYTNCQDICGPNQYAVACGSVGPSSVPPADPPPGCTTLGSNPAGITDYCCPCQ
jgi:hypothetical protein